MPETAIEIPVDETTTVDPAGEQPEPGDDLADDESEGDELEDVDPDEAEAEAQAAIEREHELAAGRQEEAQSVEAQQRDQDAKNKKLNQVAAHTAKRYGEILGPDLDGFVPCPLCLPWFPGIRLPVMPEYETVAAVKVAIGEDPDPPLANDHYSKVCDDCQGLGKVLTGSKVQGQGTAQCLPCKGKGWMPIGPERESGTITAPAAAPYVPVPGEVITNGDEPPEVAKLKELGFIVVPPVNTPESLAARGG